MKKQTRYIIYLGVFILLVNICRAQDADTAKIPVSYINVAGRYVDGKGIELRFFPDNKTVLEEGLKGGFIIERMLFDSAIARGGIDTSSYSEIARVNPYSSGQWEDLINKQKNVEAKSDLETARDFLQSSEKEKGGNFSLEKGIAELKDQKSREDYNYMVFVLAALKNPDAAIALGLAFTDTNAVPGKTYLYRVRPAGKSKIYKIISDDFRITAEPVKTAYGNPVYVNEGDTELSFAWINPAELSGYIVERADPGDAVFTQLNKAPIYNLEGSDYNGDSRSGYSDRNLVNYKMYTYRFYGYTLFGEKVRFAEVKAMPRDLTPPEEPFLMQPQNVKPNEVLVTWKMNPSPAPDLNGFYVARSNKAEGEFKVLHSGMLSKDTRSFTDTTFIRGQANYYLVQAVDTAGNRSTSFPVFAALIDSMPPVKPVIISGTIDSLGVVTITVEKNKEKDLMGYRLFKANSPEHEFSVIYEGFVNDDSSNGYIQTVFKDTVTLNSLTPYIYYRVKALDFNFNQSEFSDVIKIARPDTIAPVVPVFTNVFVSEKYVRLYFAPSSSEDVKEHIIYRRTSPDSTWKIIARLNSILSEFTDSSVTTGITYYYSMRARDAGGLYSKYASPVYGKPYDTGVRPAVENLSAEAEEKNIILSWDYPSSEYKTIFVIYKKDDKGSLVQYGLTEEKKYTDKNTGKENFYAVKAVTKDGGQSRLSAVVGKEIKK